MARVRICAIIVGMTSPLHARMQPEPVLPEDDPAPGLNLLEGDLLANAGEIQKRFQLQVRREIAAHLASGHPIFFGGYGEEAGKLYMWTPEGEVFECRITREGCPEIVSESLR